MAVKVEGGADVLVTYASFHLKGIGSVVDHENNRGVAQLMEF